MKQKTGAFSLPNQPLDGGSLKEIQEVIEFLQWAFRKMDKGDAPEETVRMLKMYRTKIENISMNKTEEATRHLHVYQGQIFIEKDLYRRIKDAYWIGRKEQLYVIRNSPKLSKRKKREIMKESGWIFKALKK